MAANAEAPEFPCSLTTKEEGNNRCASQAATSFGGIASPFGCGRRSRLTGEWTDLWTRALLLSSLHRNRQGRNRTVGESESFVEPAARLERFGAVQRGPLESGEPSSDRADAAENIAALPERPHLDENSSRRLASAQLSSASLIQGRSAKQLAGRSKWPFSQPPTTRSVGQHISTTAIPHDLLVFDVRPQEFRRLSALWKFLERFRWRFHRRSERSTWRF